MKAKIIDRGRGPEIAGTRITVFDILDYWQANWHHTAIAALFRLSSQQVMAAIQYLEQNKAEVMAEYQKAMERIQRGNPLEVEARRRESGAKLQAMLEQLKRQKGQETSDAGALSGQQR